MPASKFQQTNILPLPFLITKCQVTSSNKRTILQASSPECLFKRCHQKVLSSLNCRPNQYDSRQPCSPVKLHYPKWSRIPFPSTNLGIPLLFLVPVKMSLPSCIDSCLTNIHSILGQKWCTLYLSLFDRSNQRFHLRISGRRNLNRGICHAQFFDPRWHWHVSSGPG